MESQTVRVTSLLAVMGIGIVLSTVVFGLLSASQSVTNSGNITAVGVSIYTSSTYTTKLTHIDWGSLTPGATKNATAYIRNEGTVAVTLSMTTGNWSSQAVSTYLRVTWNRQGTQLNHQSTTQAVITLTVPTNITGVDSFSFDITITGTQV
jgi:hypothetical protein